MKPDQPVILEVVVDRQYRNYRYRFVWHRRQQHDPVHWDRRRQQRYFGTFNGSPINTRCTWRPTHATKSRIVPASSNVENPLTPPRNAAGTRAIASDLER